MPENEISSLRERIAVLEIAMASRKEEYKVLEARIANTTAKVDGVKEVTNQILQKIVRYEGKFGGILLTVGAIVTFFTFFFKGVVGNWETIIAWFKG